jgi:hypothetical protein
MPYVNGLGEEQTATQKALQSVLAPVTGALASQAHVVADPLVAKIQPMLRTELERQVPKFAIYAGLSAGFLVLIGVVTGLLTRKGAR